MNEINLYVDGLSIPEISDKTNIPRSTIYFRLKKAGVLRSKSEGMKLARAKGRFPNKKGISRKPFSQEWKNNISKAKRGVGLGYSIKPNGYKEITMGPNKGRLVHVVKVEKKIKRKLYQNECVHHIDKDKLNNDIDNLKLMTKSEHCRIHALDKIQNVKRDDKGRFLKWQQ